MYNINRIRGVIIYLQESMSKSHGEEPLNIDWGCTPDFHIITNPIQSNIKEKKNMSGIDETQIRKTMRGWENRDEKIIQEKREGFQGPQSVRSAAR